MTRPTRERVDYFVERAKVREEAIGDEWIEGGAFEAEIVLAAEVRALREANAELTKQSAYAWSDGFNSAEAGPAENEKEELLAPYKATIARVEALPAEWREKARQLRGYDVGMHEVEKCADELDAALRGPA